jgi:hypothetical protein
VAIPTSPQVPVKGNVWPSPRDWQVAIQNPKTAFDDSILKAATPATDRLGLPAVWSGNFAYVFKVANGPRVRAIRCFGRFIADRQERYEAIDRQLDVKSIASLVSFEYDGGGIRVNGNRYPILIMEWIDGNALDVYVEEVLNKPAVLEFLADEWAQTVAMLDEAGVAHGDLQHGNVLISGGHIRLVDLDGMYVPALRGRMAAEAGHRAYQHPNRDESIFDQGIDRFPGLVVYVSLRALAAKPELWRTYHDENLIFCRDDYLDPSNSRVFKEVLRIGGEVARLAAVLEQACRLPMNQTPRISDIVTIRQSKLPAWMRPVPPGGLEIKTKTREAKDGDVIRPAAAHVVRETASTIYGTQPAGVSMASPVGSSQPLAPAVPAASTVSPRWFERFARGFGEVLAVSWWVIVLFLLTGDLIVIGAVLALILFLACAGGFFALALRTGTVSRSPHSPPTVAPAPPQRTTVAPAPPQRWSTAPRGLQTARAQSVPGTAAGQVVASSIRSIYHRPSCEWAVKMSRRNKLVFGSSAEARQRGLRACRVCRP